MTSSRRSRGVRALTALSAALLLTACTGTDDDAAADAETSTSSAAPSEDSSAEPAMACLPGSTAVEGFDGTAATVGTGKTAVVLVNGAGESACAWQGLATKAVDAGHRVYAFEYASDGPPLGDRRAELQSIVKAAKGAGAERVVTVGGSRGGCLALTEAATNTDISAVAVVSCATVWNREDPTPLAPYLPKVKQPVLEVIATEDPDVSVAEVDVDSRALPNAEMITAPGGAHGSILANDPVVSEQLLEFIGAS